MGNGAHSRSYKSPPGRSARAYQNRRARDSGPPGAVLAGPARCQAGSVLAARAAHTAKADVVVPVLGRVPVPVRRPQVPRVVVPRGAPAQHAANSRKFLMDLPEVSMPYPAPVANRQIGGQCGRHIPTRTKPAAHPKSPIVPASRKCMRRAMRRSSASSRRSSRLRSFESQCDHFE